VEEALRGESENVALVQQAYAAFGRGDIAALLEMLSDDIDWHTPGAPRIPYAGRFSGRKQVAGFFEGLGKTAEFERFEPREFFAHGDKVVVLGHYAGRGRTTGRPFATDWAMVFTVRNGKIAAFSEHFDTFNLGAAFSA
jgi:ketosteroid isomerase-like protein